MNESWYQKILRRFRVDDDQADHAQIDANLRAGVALGGSNLWVLMLAIFIASIGLNVNSTAVIIGAMLVSPLMGPIMGIGYGVGIYDFALIRKSLGNLGIATLISLLTSTLYFWITPLDGAQSELLARTSPTLWDVLIALFGGLAGMIGATRKEKTNLIPGVAIATALMPPLCTAGYALANAHWAYFLGAFYLFSINGVFIAVATAVVTSLLKLPHRKFVDAATEARVKKILLLVVIVTALPSCFLAYQLVEEEVFKKKAKEFIRQEMIFSNSHVTETKFHPRSRNIELTLIGETLDAAHLRQLELKLASHGLQGSSVTIHQGHNNAMDVATLKEGIVAELFSQNEQKLKERDQKINELQAKLVQQSALPQHHDMAQELLAQNQQVLAATISLGKNVDRASSMVENLLVLNLETRCDFSPAQIEQIEQWFKVRAKTDKVKVFSSIHPSVAAKKRAAPRCSF